MNFCIIGLKWGKNYIKNLSFLEQEVKFICSRNLSDLDPQLSELQHVDDFLKIDLSAIDVACICSPPSTHFEMCKYFLTHNKHVIVEKPFVFLPHQAEHLKSLAEENNVSLLITYQYLWNRDYLATLSRIKKNIGNGVIENNSIGNVSRNEYSFLWDYSSHDLAMTYHIIGEKTPLTIKFFEETEDGYSYTLMNDEWVINNSFRFKPGLKLRNMILDFGDDTDKFVDNYSDNALLSMLSEFIDVITSGARYTNIDLAIAVTTSLAELSNFKGNS